jgi:hypothetical protein
VTIEGVCLPRSASGAVDYSLPVLSLGPADSGAPNAPIQWVAGPAGGTLSAGATIPSGAWKPVSACVLSTSHEVAPPAVVRLRAPVPHWACVLSSRNVLFATHAAFLRGPCCACVLSPLPPNLPPGPGSHMPRCSCDQRVRAGQLPWRLRELEVRKFGAGVRRGCCGEGKKPSVGAMARLLTAKQWPFLVCPCVHAVR